MSPLGLLPMAGTRELKGGAQDPAGGTGLELGSSGAHSPWDLLWVTLRV